MNLCLFDLDHTLLPLDSDHSWGEFMVRIGWADPAEHRAGNDAFYAQYQAGTLDVAAYIEFATRPWRERPAAELAQVHARFMRELIEPAILPPALALVAHHREAGDRLAIVTATNDFVTAPIARAFDVDTLIAVELERAADGRCTGRVAGVPSFREGKVARVEAWLAADGARLQDFERVTVYSDSPNDLPLLEIATDPVATNPSPALAVVARERGWRVLNLFSPS
ncbi:HAD family hydrolase [Rivibacter subsaxonicus]|uniref:HAD superfamily hydrolase (TIGR01490 family) n=1 Tax=Rivibacter subsaxonicus TaxID=457575 RepID=A0A4Q7VHI4_9BURK|nr:HAD family hydrolase [Rivibacter subsaxonicus]RZT95368.1 HAD superfamily hydrolase (TIGR01490 family) [Rivibacter subsaxonicus]